MTNLFKLAVLGLLFNACGKPHETMEMEKGRYAVIDSIHHIEMKNHRMLMDAEKQLDSLRSIFLNSKDKTHANLVSQLDSVAQGVQLAIQRMNQIMPGLAQPDYQELTHTDVMAILDKQAAGLDSVARQMAEASSSFNQFKTIADSLLTTTIKSRR